MGSYVGGQREFKSGVQAGRTILPLHVPALEELRSLLLARADRPGMEERDLIQLFKQLVGQVII